MLAHRLPVCAGLAFWSKHHPVFSGIHINEFKSGYPDAVTVISHYELPRLKKLINDIDPHAFVVVSETLEVMGRNIGNQPHW
jgi:uncharacterized membrane-anchored protein YitT (DUF2179 family)